MSDEELVLEMSEPTEAYLPKETLTTLTNFVLIPSAELALHRLDGLELLLNEWDGLESAADFLHWTEEFGNVAIYVCRGADGKIERCGERIGEAAIPAETVQVLTQSIVGGEPNERFLAIEALREFLAECSPYFDDAEKVAGHLVLAHEAGASVASLTHDEMLQMHSTIHGEVRESVKDTEREIAASDDEYR